jgi:hypothetical protein
MIKLNHRYRRVEDKQNWNSLGFKKTVFVPLRIEKKMMPTKTETNSENEVVVLEAKEIPIVYYRTENEDGYNHSDQSGCSVDDFEKYFETLV